MRISKRFKLSKRSYLQASVEGDLVQQYPDLKKYIMEAEKKIQKKYLRWFANILSKEADKPSAVPKLYDYIKEFENNRQLLPKKDLYQYDLTSLQKEISEIKSPAHNARKKAEEYFEFLSQQRNKYEYEYRTQDARAAAYEDGRKWLEQIEPKSFQSLVRKEIRKIIAEREKNRGGEEQARAHSDVIFEDDDFLVVLPGTTAASKYFGAGTQWCTTAENDNMFSNYSNKNVYLYYIINKKSKNKFAWAAAKNKNGISSEIYDASDTKISEYELKRHFPTYFDVKTVIMNDLSKRDNTKFQEILTETTPEQLAQEIEINGMEEWEKLDILRTVKEHNHDPKMQSFVNEKFEELPVWAVLEYAKENHPNNPLPAIWQISLLSKLAVSGSSEFTYLNGYNFKDLMKIWVDKVAPDIFTKHTPSTYDFFLAPNILEYSDVIEKVVANHNDFDYTSTRPRPGNEKVLWVPRNVMLFLVKITLKYKKYALFYYLGLFKWFPSIAKQIVKQWADKGDSILWVAEELSELFPEEVRRGKSNYRYKPYYAKLAKIKVPHRKQQTNYSCGAAALRQILAVYKIDVDEEDLVKQLKTNKNGTDPYKIVAVTKTYGLKAQLLTNMSLKTLKQLINDGIPCMVMMQMPNDNEDMSKTWTEGHYAVVSTVNDKITLVDPGTKAKTHQLTKETFMERWHDIDLKGNKLTHAAITFYKEVI